MEVCFCTPFDKAAGNSILLIRGVPLRAKDFYWSMIKFERVKEKGTLVREARN